MGIKNLMTNNIVKFIEEGGDEPVLIDFWGYGCPPCKAIQPILEEENDSEHTALKFGKINLDENEEVAPKYQLRSVPTLIIFHHGKEVKRMVVPSVDDLRSVLIEYRSN